MTFFSCDTRIVPHSSWKYRIRPKDSCDFMTRAVYRRITLKAIQNYISIIFIEIPCLPWRRLKYSDRLDFPDLADYEEHTLV